MTTVSAAQLTRLAEQIGHQYGCDGDEAAARAGQLLRGTAIPAPADVAALAVVRLHDRAGLNDQDGPREWGGDDPAGSCRRFSALCRTAAAWTADGAVVVSVAGPDVGIWGYVAAEALDQASAGLPGTWVISEPGPGVSVLSPA